MRPDNLCHLCGAVEDVIVPEAEEAEAASGQFRIPHCVPEAFRMLRTISLDDQLCLIADEVRDVGADGNLTSKLEAYKTAIA